MTPPGHTCPGLDRAQSSARRLSRRLDDVARTLEPLNVLPGSELAAFRTAVDRAHAAGAQLVADLDRVCEENGRMRAALARAGIG